MGGSYRQCSDCGKRALSIATRCPGCGRELPALPAAESYPALDLRRLLSPNAVLGIVATTAVLIAAAVARTHRPLEQQRSLVVPDSTSAVSQVAYTTASAVRVDTATASLSPPTNASEVLVARTWTNVRKSRNKLADLEAVLLPGDTVLADSLERGWYRVTLEGEVLGYVHHSTLIRP
jgi:hypothetical protein